MVWDQAISFVPIAVAFVLAYIGLNLEQDNAPLKVFFILLSLWILVLGMGNLIEINQDAVGGVENTDITSNLERGYQAIMWSAILGTIYFAIIFLKDLLMWFASFGGAKKIW